MKGLKILTKRVFRFTKTGFQLTKFGKIGRDFYLRKAESEKKSIFFRKIFRRSSHYNKE